MFHIILDLLNVTSSFHFPTHKFCIVFFLIFFSLPVMRMRKFGDARHLYNHQSKPESYFKEQRTRNDAASSPHVQFDPGQWRHRLTWSVLVSCGSSFQLDHLRRAASTRSLLLPQRNLIRVLTTMHLSAGCVCEWVVCVCVCVLTWLFNCVVFACLYSSVYNDVLHVCRF